MFDVILTVVVVQTQETNRKQKRERSRKDHTHKMYEILELQMKYLWSTGTTALENQSLNWKFSDEYHLFLEKHLSVVHR